jgi:hypothetical protein
MLTFALLFLCDRRSFGGGGVTGSSFIITSSKQRRETKTTHNKNKIAPQKQKT